MIKFYLGALAFAVAYQGASVPGTPAIHANNLVGHYVIRTSNIVMTTRITYNETHFVLRKLEFHRDNAENRFVKPEACIPRGRLGMYVVNSGSRSGVESNMNYELGNNQLTTKGAKCERNTQVKYRIPYI